MEQESPTYKDYTLNGSVQKVKSAIVDPTQQSDSLSIDLSN